MWLALRGAYRVQIGSPCRFLAMDGALPLLAAVTQGFRQCHPDRFFRSHA